MGRKFAASKEFLLHADVTTVLVSLSLALEPLRALTAWWMRRAKQAENFSCRRPLMDAYLDLDDHHAIHFILPRGWLREVAHGVAPKLARDVRFKKFPLQVKQLRCVMILASASNYRRHVRTLRAYPWLLVSLADRRLNDSAREHDIAACFSSESACCFPPGFAKKLKERGVSGKDLLHDELTQEIPHVVLPLGSHADLRRGVAPPPEPLEVQQTQPRQVVAQLRRRIHQRRGRSAESRPATSSKASSAFSATEAARRATGTRRTGAHALQGTEPFDVVFGKTRFKGTRSCVAASTLATAGTGPR